MGGREVGRQGGRGEGKGKEEWWEVREGGRKGGREEGREGGREEIVHGSTKLCHTPSEDSVFHELVVPDARVLEQREDEVPVPLWVFFC